MTDSPSPPERPPLLPRPISPAHLQAIGAVVALWSHIEMAFDIAILNIYGMPPDSGLVIMSLTSFNSKSSVLKLLGGNHPKIPDGRRKHFIKAIESIETLYKERNEVAHAMWIGTDDPSMARRMSIIVRSGKLKVWNDQIHISRLMAITQALQERYLSFLALLVELGLQGEPVPEAS